MTKHTQLWKILWGGLLLLWMVTPVQAQAPTPEMTLHLRRDFGYGAGLDLQGVFSLRLDAPDEIQRVEFLMDGEVLTEMPQAPFQWQSNTDNYKPGLHKFVAVGYTGDGRELRSQEVSSNFLSAEDAQKATTGIMFPMLGGIFGLMIIAFLATILLGGRKGPALPPGAHRTYGVAGGAICPKCGRPFSRHFFAPNMLIGKLERCPHCGKVSIVPARSQAELAAAEAAEVAAAGGPTISELSEEERLRRDLDASRYREE